MEISLAFGSFLVVLAACALAARQKAPLYLRCRAMDQPAEMDIAS